MKKRIWTIWNFDPDLNAFQDEAGNWDVDEDQTMKMKCDFVISAFGSGLYSEDLKSAMAPLKLNRWAKL